jgi:iron complex outermembrane recepter protein
MRVGIILFTGVSVLSLAAPAFGQADPQQATPAAADVVDDTGELAPGNEIIVSARRRQESVQDVPQTVNVVTSAQIDKLNLRSFTEIASVVPGLTLTPGASFGSSATLRGVAFSPEASGNNPTVEFYINDAPISSNFVFQSLFDVGQFEVQRGPQGTLRGRASPSGSIVFNTRRPDLDEAGLVVNGTLTDIHAQKLDVAINVPIIKDVLGVRLAGVDDESQGSGRVFTIKQLTQPQFNPDPLRHTKSLRASVLFEPTDWITAGFMYQTLNTRSKSYAQVQSLCLVTGAACAPTATQPTIRPFDRLSVEDQGGAFVQQHDVYVANVDVRFAGQQLSYVGAYNKQDFNAFGTTDAGDFFSAPAFSIVARPFANPPAAFEPVCSSENRRTKLTPTTGEFYQCTHTIAKRESHELRLASQERVAGIFDYVIGALYDKNGGKGPLFGLDATLNLVQETPIVGFGRIFLVNATPIVRTGGESTEKSVFGNLTAHIGENLELSGGLRHIHYKANPNFLAISGGTPNFIAGDNENKTVYTASAKYQFTPDMMVYANVGSSFRPGPRAIGNFSTGPEPTRSGPTARELAFSNLPPETSTSYEVGAKTSFFDRRARLNVALYRQDFKNFVFRGPGVTYRTFSLQGPAGAQLAQPGVGGFNFVSPVPVRVNGAELEASYQILERWSLGLNASYADGKIRNGTIACNDFDQNGIPDAVGQFPTPANAAALNAVLPAGQNLSLCPNYNSRASFSSKFSANVQSELGFDVTENMGGFVRGLYNFLGKNVNDPNNGFDDVGAFGLLNLYAGLRDSDGGWEISVFGKNILREREVLSTTGVPLSTNVQGFAGSTRMNGVYVPVSVTAPREFGITARIAIGSH